MPADDGAADEVPAEDGAADEVVVVVVVAGLLLPPHAASTSASKASATYPLPPRAPLNDLRTDIMAVGILGEPAGLRACGP
ncbi:MAG: hypothetical protein ACRDOL_12740 [Streptosporangiaceae bacterium]